jgi:hypothetical protein
VSDLIEFADGTLIIEDTGEIISCPVSGDDMLSYLVAQYRGAKEQIKGHERAARALEAAILARQQERRIQCGDYTSTIRQNTYRRLDRERYLDGLEAGEWSRDELLELARCMKDLDPVAATKPLIEDFIMGCQVESQSRPFVVVDVVKRPAPRVRPAPVDLAQALDESLEAVR